MTKGGFTGASGRLPLQLCQRVPQRDQLAQRARPGHVDGLVHAGAELAPGTPARTMFRTPLRRSSPP